MHICFACDDRYAPYAEVVIRSVLAHAEGEAPNIVLISDGVSPASSRSLSSLCREFSAQFDVIDVEPILSGLDFSHGHLTRAAFGRLCIPEVVSEEKVIYLDVDTICTRSLEPLWAARMGDSCAMMVESSWSYYRGHKQRIGLAGDDPYFNSGVAVLDVKKLRGMSFFERSMDVVRSKTSMLKFADQDVINVLLKGSILPLHPRWNVATSLFDWRPGQTLTYGLEEARAALRSPSIIHYTGNRKPWHPDCAHPYAGVFRVHQRGSGPPPET